MVECSVITHSIHRKRCKNVLLFLVPLTLATRRIQLTWTSRQKWVNVGDATDAGLRGRVDRNFNMATRQRGFNVGNPPNTANVGSPAISANVGSPTISANVGNPMNSANVV